MFDFLKKKNKKEDFANVSILPKSITESSELELRDILAPSALKVNSKEINLGEKLVRSFFVISSTSPTGTVIAASTITPLCVSPKSNPTMSPSFKTFTDSFKKEVALEALKERNTVNEIAAKHGISASMVSNWKRSFFLEGSQRRSSS